jgi:CO dehydrogenase/acetyl-CoA synthase beta subunit
MGIQGSNEESQKDIIRNLSDHSELILGVQELVDETEHSFRKIASEDLTECGRFLSSYEDAKKNKRNILLAEDTAIELGSPGCISASSLLWTKKTGIVKSGIWISGPDLNESLHASYSYAQLIMAGLENDADPTDAKFQNLKNLTNRIPGYMTRCVPGKIWVRISKVLMKNGFNLLELARCLMRLYRESFRNIKSLSVVLAAGETRAASELESICEMARIVTFNNKRRKLIAEGKIICGKSRCVSCSDSAVCDAINR